MQKISIIHGYDREKNLKECLHNNKWTIKKSIETKKSNTLFIKVNTVNSNFPECCTSPQALKTVLEYFYDKFDNIVIGDNSKAFKNNNNIYSFLKKDFPKIGFSNFANAISKKIKLQCLHKEEEVKISLIPKKVYSISLALPKTHDTFVFTGCLKNMAVGMILDKKWAIHALPNSKRILLNNLVKSNKYKNHNLYLAIKETYPDLSIMDGFQGMEGNGPVHGELRPLNIALCSTDGVAVDTISSYLIGFENIPYLKLCAKKGLGIGELSQMKFKISGFKKFDDIRTQFKPHYLYPYQIMDPETDVSNLDFNHIKNLLYNFKKNKKNLQNPKT